MNNADNGTAEQLLNVLCPMFTQFAAVARELQITKAAKALDVPQPTVTRHLARLENVLGVRLCKRVRGGIALTPEESSCRTGGTGTGVAHGGYRRARILWCTPADLVWFLAHARGGDGAVLAETVR